MKRMIVYILFNVAFTPQAKLPTLGWKLLKTRKRVFQVTVRCQQRNHKSWWKYFHQQDTIYEYFKNECGTVLEYDIHAEFRPTYDHLSKRQLKRA